MEFKLESGKIKELSVLSKTYRYPSLYLKTNDSDLDYEHLFAIYDDNGTKLGLFETSIAPNKPVINIRRMKMQANDLHTQYETLQSFISYLWDYQNTHHLILNIHIDAPGSGMDSSLLIHLGFCDNGYKRETFSMLNPLYSELVSTFSETGGLKMN